MRRHILPISGKDSCATAIVQMGLEPDLPYELMFNATGEEVPEVFDWLKKVEAKLGLPIHFAGKSLEKIIEGYGYFLPGPRRRYCTKESKIDGMTEFIGDDPATVYFGIRYDEDRKGFDDSKYKNITPAYPLIDAHVDLMGVYTILDKFDLRPPTYFWPRLYEEVCRICDMDVRPHVPRLVFDHLMHWRSRSNCSICFFQAAYEYAGLFDIHPRLFKKNWWYETKGYKSDKTITMPLFGEIDIEGVPGHDLSFEDWLPHIDAYMAGEPVDGNLIRPRHTLQSGYSMRNIWELRDYYMKERAKKVASLIWKYLGKPKQSSIFSFFEDDDHSYILEKTDCGLMCSK